jgi:HNH endonuclease/AP2 domain
VLRSSELLTAECLRELLNYNPETGDFVWRVKRNSRGGGVRPGTVARYVFPSGYRGIRTGGCLYLAHRLAWLWTTGAWPVAEIDHINGVRADNRWSNLREATRAQNARNTRRPAHNTSGFKGIYRTSNKWAAKIRLNGKQIHLGTFGTPEAAGAAYAVAVRWMFGEFARAA